MNYLLRSLLLLGLLTTACYAEEAALPEKNLLEKLTEFFFPETPPETTLAEKAEAAGAENIKKVSATATDSKKPAEQEPKKIAAKPLPEVSMGSKDAPVVIINYSSLSCGHCAHFHTDTLPEIQEKYIKPGYLRIVFRDYPGDQVSLKAHQLAWCKGEIKYLDLLKILYAAQDKWLLADDPVAALKALALQNGIPAQQFDACLKNQELLDQIIALRLDGQKKYNIKATPTIIVNAKIYQKALSLEEFDDIMKPFLASSKEKTTNG